MHIRDLPASTTTANSGPQVPSKNNEDLFAEFSETLDKIATRFNSNGKNPQKEPPGSEVSEVARKTSHEKKGIEGDLTKVKKEAKSLKTELAVKKAEKKQTSNEETVAKEKLKKAEQEDDDAASAKSPNSAKKEEDTQDIAENPTVAQEASQPVQVPIVQALQNQPVKEDQTESEESNQDQSAQSELPFGGANRESSQSPETTQAQKNGTATLINPSETTSLAEETAVATSPGDTATDIATATATATATAAQVTAESEVESGPSDIEAALLTAVPGNTHTDLGVAPKTDGNLSTLFEKLILERALHLTNKDSVSANPWNQGAEELTLKNILNTQGGQGVGKTGILPTQSNSNTAHGLLNSINQGNERAENASSPGEMRETMKGLTRQQELRTLERVESALKEIARGKDGKTISVRLDPPDLGTVKIDVSLREGTLHARIVAETPQVQNLLKEKSHELVQMIRKLGLNVEKVSVAVGDQQQQADANLSFSQSSFQSNEHRDDNGANGRQGRGSSTGFVQSPGVVRSKEIIDDHWVA